MKNTNNRNTRQTGQLSGDERIVNRAAERKRKNRMKKLIIRGVLGVLFLIAGTVLVLTMFFNISEITVSGDAIYSNEEIIAASGVNIEDNLIFISKSKINENITTKLAYVGNVQIKRHLPSRVEFIVTQTYAKYAVASGGYFTLLDPTGKVLEKDIEYVADNIILVNLGEIIEATVGKKIILQNENSLEKLTKVMTEVDEVGLTNITALDLSNLYNIKLVYQGRITLELGETDGALLGKKLDLGRAAIETQNEENELYRGTINLTIEGKGYWSEETSTTVPVTEPESVTGETVTDENGEIVEEVTEKEEESSTITTTNAA